MPRRVDLDGCAAIWLKGHLAATGLWRLAQWPSFVPPLWALALASRGRRPPWVVTLSLRRWGTVALSPQGVVVPARLGVVLGAQGARRVQG